jgi:competence protein ComEA
MDRRWLVGGMVAVAAVLAGIWFGRGVEDAPDLGPAISNPADSVAMPTASTDRSPPTTRVLVYVSGWVAEPGVVSLPPGARVGDAIARAGGARPGADLEGVNLAQPLMDGQQVMVPGPAGTSGPLPSVPGDDRSGPIRLNAATAEELESLPGVGPVLAERIVAHREQVGPYEKVEDLLGVPGIGETKLAAIRDLVAVP